MRTNVTSCDVCDVQSWVGYERKDWLELWVQMTPGALPVCLDICRPCRCELGMECATGLTLPKLLSDLFRKYLTDQE